MKIGDQIEVLVKDIDVMKNLLSLIEQLSGYSIEKHREKKEYRLVIGKSEEDA